MVQKQNKVHQNYYKQKINKHTAADFQLNVSYETWNLFDGNYVNRIFGYFLNSFLRNFYSST